MSWTCPTCQREWDNKPAGGLEPAVLASVNVARAERGEAPLERGYSYAQANLVQGPGGTLVGCIDCGYVPPKPVERDLAAEWDAAL